MIIYNETAESFISHVLEQRIEDVLLTKVKEKISHSVSESEIRSWTNSLPEMARVIRDAELENNTHVLLEYKLPSSEKRIDFLVTGQNQAGEDHAVIIELKQWQKSEVADGDGIVKTFLGRRVRETVHPAYQSLSYQRYLENFNEALYDDTSIQLSSCSFLHNYIPNKEAEPLLDERYSSYLEQSPVYFKFDDKVLQKAIKEKVAIGNGADIARRIEDGRIGPSKKLVESVQSLMKGNEAFILLDEQKVAYEKALSIYQQADLETAQKEVVLIKGGPGTGKSVIGLNLMNAFLNDKANVEYITPNQSFREILKKKLVGRSGFTEVRNLFKGSGSYVQAPEDYYDVLICDEAHRLKNQGHMQRKIEGENQATQIIRASKIAVFFIDDEQMISKKDIGSVTLLKEEAEKQGAILHELELDSQFRCGGSGNFLEWVDDVLYEENQEIQLEGDYDFRIVDSPNELYEEIVMKRDGRLVAGYAWEWNKELVNGELPKDVEIESEQFAMPWNDPNRIDWAIHPEGKEQVGCIHTVQGLEMGYVGVIIGDDLTYNNDTQQLEVIRENFKDKGARPAKPKGKYKTDDLDRLVRNTYKTLMTRGMKGCYVYCVDEGLREYLRS
ncbi:DUF2075 domain-containing protein [Salisediminibacterium selenitireducens]|uniref:AAA+ ATPase domain-containing protein n=1 Tax=Bacillus selenitireducens (strain ATCC 700615 / DSM 15326 / MLS10) TaxID=439292 RepID=D6XXW6_BACIE|nr:DUF2075 domain-containing protein [Salisediminibacterium selenitireducens]ADI00159.1 Protein of unknown function DUF2075 [[Bacillus] selenitireducens MLS10]